MLELKAATSGPSTHQLLEARLIDGDLAAPEAIDSRLVDIDTRDESAEFSKARP